MKTIFALVSGMLILSNLAFAQSAVEYKVEAKERTIKKVIESVTPCVANYVREGRSCSFRYEFSVISRITSQKWLEDRGRMIPNSMVTVEEVKAEPFDKTDSTAECYQQTAQYYCDNVLRKPYAEVMGLLNRN